ncbi:MAG: dTDP-4-amino-4,6-dideoxyglucose formyltransferase [Cryomorphaceae bacterium]|nr:dTDP-4-amino-4,6-dideoxyglucose formyltransferase [Cryomorphaceae bacterium]
MKRSLILSDNQSICSKIFEVNKELNICEYFDYGTSIYSDLAQFTFSNSEIRSFNLKENDSVNFISKNYDLVFSVHYKQLFPTSLINKVKCYNLHPGYNPLNRGWYPQVFSIINDTPIGATLHEIDAEIDNGCIIDRELVDKHDWDTSFTLYQRIIDKEIELWKRNIINILNEDFVSFAPENEGYLYLKKDFKNLLEIDLNQKSTFKEFLDLLRALTFDKYKNAYFYDSDRSKIFVSINLDKEDK